MEGIRKKVRNCVAIEDKEKIIIIIGISLLCFLIKVSVFGGTTSEL